MTRMMSMCVCLLAALPVTAVTTADGAESAQQLYDRVTPSLVAVRYLFQNELGRRELTGPGVIVAEDGLVMCPLLMFNSNIPDQQMRDFKILVPRENGEPEEFSASFQGRDERINMAFLKTTEPQHWKPLKFDQAPLKIGDAINSIGMLPKAANYKAYFMQGSVSALLRGELPQVLVTGGGLAAFGSPVFNSEGQAIGVVSFSPGQSLLNDGPQQELTSVMNPPRFFTPSSDFLIGIQDPPTPDKPIVLPWMGVSQMSGVNKDLAEAMGFGDQPAIQIGDVIPDSPADKAGLKSGDFITKLDGKELERGDEPAELPAIMTRRLQRRKPGDKITLSIVREKDQAPKDVEVALAQQPKRANQAKRFFADDLGFVVRELVFYDIYGLKLPSDQKGVIVALLRPQAAAQTGGLHMNDVITRLDNEPVTDLDQFEKSYKQLRKDKPRQAIVMEVRRGDREDTVRIEPPQ